MRVLIVGAFGTVTSAIIRKFGKEGARIYALTGGKNSENRYKKVYEQYDFSYDNNCIKEVFESVNPDVTIFTGAFDSNFEWSSGYSEMVKFGAGLYNCLNAFSFLNHGRLYFYHQMRLMALMKVHIKRYYIHKDRLNLEQYVLMPECIRQVH